MSAGVLIGFFAGWELSISHRLILSYLYGSGPRSWDQLQLKISDILLDKLKVFVRDRNGNKDLVAILSEQQRSLTQNLKNYRTHYYLAEGVKGGKYSRSNP